MAGFDFDVADREIRVAAEQLTFRDAIRKAVPVWLQKGNAEKILYALAIQFDGLTDAVTAGVKARFPGLYSPESLAVLGRDRRIRRGRYDTDQTYATRLLRWLDDHANRGGPYAMLQQIHAHFAPNNFPIELVYASGARFALATDGTITRDYTFPLDGDPAQWARWTLYYHWPVSYGSDGTWGAPGLWGDGGVWGSNVPPDTVTDLKLVPTEWNAAHALGTLVLLGPGAGLWGVPPTDTWGMGGDVWDVYVRLAID